MAVFLQANPHRPDEPWHSGWRPGQIEPTSDSLASIAEALRMLRPLWVPGLRYFKVADRQQPRMLFATHDPVKSAKAMQAPDAVNARYGRGTLRPLATGIARPWAIRHDRLSRRYTTRIEEILVATAWWQSRRGAAPLPPSTVFSYVAAQARQEGRNPIAMPAKAAAARSSASPNFPARSASAIRSVRIVGGVPAERRAASARSSRACTRSSASASARKRLRHAARTSAGISARAWRGDRS